MAKNFLGSVGRAEAFRINPATKKLELAFVSKTLTDSGLNISTSKDEIRGGQGAPVQFVFCHDSSVEITLTDIVWKPEYVTAQLGAEFATDNEAFKYYNGGNPVTFTSEGITIDDIKEMKGLNCGVSGKVAWACKRGSDEYFMLDEDTSTHKYKLPDGYSVSDQYCVRYLGTVSGAKTAEITATILPEELYLIITAPIFAGDACSASRGKAAGEVQFIVPRFVLNGGQDFAMNMSSNQNMSLAGTAMAAESAACDASGGLLLEIKEVIADRKWYSDVTELIVDAETLVADTPIGIYGLEKNGTLTDALYEDLEYKAHSGSEYSDFPSNGQLAAGTYDIRIKNKPEVIDESVVVA